MKSASKPYKKEFMNPTTHEPVTLNSEEELSVLAELLDSERARLLVGIRHTFHREYRQELQRKLDVVESLIKRIGKGA
ncbi:MAG TPA: hypothetical protein VK789_30315 [Bryobacteraceae bacterium]|nr:hypothetical protein [Bryobacteraceae bacterium]